jgi:hypothetical protein
MPLLDDAKNCFVGQTQIKQIYAGTQLVWPKGRDCDNSGRPVVPANFRVDTYSGNSSQYACAWHRTPGQETTGWQTTTELKLAGSNSWTNKKTVSYPSVFTVYNKTEFGPNPTLQKQTEVRCKNIDPDGNTSCFVYTFPRT